MDHEVFPRKSIASYQLDFFNCTLNCIRDPIRCAAYADFGYITTGGDYLIEKERSIYYSSVGTL